MAERARIAGVHFKQDIEPPQSPNPTGRLHKSWNTWQGWLLHLVFLGERPRTLPKGARIHASVTECQAAMDYKPDVLPNEYHAVDHAQTQ